MAEQVGNITYAPKILPVDFARMRQERAARARAIIKKNNVAAALLFRPENIAYAVGNPPLSFIDRLAYAMVFAEHDTMIYLPETMFNIPYAGWPMPAVSRENMRTARYWANQTPGPEAVRQVAKQWAQEIKEDLRQKGLDKERLGYDGYLDAPGLEALAEAGLQVYDVQPVMLEARAIKTQDEIMCLRTAAAVADAGHYGLYQALKPGIKKVDLGMAVLEAMVAAGGEFRGSAAMAPEIARAGDLVNVDIAGPRYMGYCTCVYRNYMVGRKPNARERELHKKAVDRMYRVIGAIKPGATTADAARHWATAADLGLPSEWCTWCDELGHGLGLSLYEYPIINRLYSLEHPMEFQKGMVMAVECMEHDPAIGRVKVEEMVVVTDNGVEMLTRMPVRGIMTVAQIGVAEE